MREFRVKRIYDDPSLEEGVRLLVDRLWPRGISKAAAKIDLWAKELTPSHELRTWLHDPFADASFASVDLLPAPNKTADDTPIGMSVDAR